MMRNSPDPVFSFSIVDGAGPSLRLPTLGGRAMKVTLRQRRKWKNSEGLSQKRRSVIRYA
jgi:hypothetical protein